jgi:hypothetical protein
MRNLCGQGGKALFKFVHSRERRNAAPFQRRRHEAVLRLDGVALPLRALRLVSGLAEFQLNGVADGLSLLGAGISGPTRRVDRAGREHAQNLAADRLIDAESAER